MHGVGHGKPESALEPPASFTVIRVLQVCTFAGNRPQVLRCAVCDSLRGTRWETYAGSSLTEVGSPLGLGLGLASGQEKAKGRAGGQKGDHA